jgi:hypothetical protein
MENICANIDCNVHAKYRCNQCLSTYYCSTEHQKIDWKTHKKFCINLNAGSNGSKQIIDLKIDNNDNLATEQKKVCRCMFCGKELILNSEEAAIDHMRICDALQEQLSSKEQFTIPAALKNQMESGNFK